MKFPCFIGCRSLHDFHREFCDHIKTVCPQGPQIRALYPIHDVLFFYRLVSRTLYRQAIIFVNAETVMVSAGYHWHYAAPTIFVKLNRSPS